MSLDFDPAVDYYKALGVTPQASAAEIKKAYRKLAKQSHPDSTGGDKRKEARFKEVSAAYDVLGDAKRRAQYDEIRALGGRVRPGGGPGGAGFPGGGFSGGFGGSQVWDLGDLFSTMFQSGGGAAATGARGRRTRFERTDDDWSPPVSPAVTEQKVQAPDGTWLTVRGNDVHSDVRISFERAILGTVVEVATTAGTTSMKIPPGTSSGRKLRLRGKGVAIDQRGPGDHYVTVQVDVPAELDEKGKQLLHELTSHLAARPKKK